MQLYNLPTRQPYNIPRRIVSLVPSQTELLFDLGLDDEVVGITKFCVHPKDKVRNKTKVGGTKNFHFDIIDELRPDLILGNKEENYQEGIEQLRAKYPVWVSDIETLEDALEMILRVGEVVGKTLAANRLATEIRVAFQELVVEVAQLKYSPSVAYFIWRKPWMVAGSGTFIDTMLAYCGLENAFGTLSRYPEISPEQLREVAPNLILLSSEPYPFKEKHLAELQEICPSAKGILVDGEMFSWYGSRLKLSAKYFQFRRVNFGFRM